jgi:hypothetical protein
MLQGYGHTVLRVETLEKELAKAGKHSTMLQYKLDGAFAQYHNEVQDMQAKSDELICKNKSLHQNLVEYLLWVPYSSLTSPFDFFIDLEARVEQLKASEVDMKNLFYREKDAREVLEYDYKQLAHECNKHMELRIASNRELVNCYKYLQKLGEDCEKLLGQHKELEEAALPIARLLVPHPGGQKIAPLVDRLKEAP